MFQFLRGIALITTFTFLFSMEKAKAQTLGDLVHYCERLETYWRQFPPSQSMTIPNDGLGSLCLGFLMGFRGASRLVDPPSDCTKAATWWGPNCHPRLHVCVPATGVSYEQILAVFLAYGRSHPAQWHEEGVQHVHLAMLTAFPCPTAQ